MRRINKCLPLRSDLRLHSFHLRHESSNQTFRALLIAFLEAIHGLSHLSVFLEANESPPSYRSVLQAHRSSLKPLVWEERTGRQFTFVTRAGSKSQGSQQLEDIAKYCPSLEELVVLVKWKFFSDIDTYNKHVYTSCVVANENPRG